MVVLECHLNATLFCGRKYFNILCILLYYKLVIVAYLCVRYKNSSCKYYRYFRRTPVKWYIMILQFSINITKKIFYPNQHRPMHLYNACVNETNKTL